MYENYMMCAEQNIYRFLQFWNKFSGKTYDGSEIYFLAVRIMKVEPKRLSANKGYTNHVRMVLIRAPDSPM